MRYQNSTYLLICLIFFSACENERKADISEEEQTITTYSFGDPSPVPVLAQGREYIYPYFRYDGYSRTGEDQEWKVVTLENEYIKLSVLPEVGGKIWGAIEKNTGKEFIYKNEVLKFRNIALRGPWTSGGIEFNFGIQGHTPTTGTPVDYLIRENEDGSVSCVIGALDLPSRTHWRVTITLPKDKAYFETESLWYNPTSLDHSYYVWMNAAIKAADDLQLFFPGNLYIGHSGDAHPWPVDKEGRDLSYYANNDFGPNKSYHVLGEKTEFFGGYWHDEDFGFGHWSHYNDMPGKKIWIWSLARSGGIWEDLLTDTDSQYVEVQSGRQFSQASSESNKTPFDQAAFQAAATDHWKEFWFPVKETGGLAAASPYGVLNLEHNGNELILSVMALQAIDDELAVYSGDELIDEKSISLNPLEVYSDTITFAGDANRLHIILGDRKLVYNGEKSGELDRPMETISNEAQEVTASGLYQNAQNQGKSRRYNEALKLYTAALEKDASHTQSYTGLAEIYYRRGEYEKAIHNAAKAISFNTFNAASNLIYGLAKSEIGKNEQALEALGWAARSIKYRSSAYTSMAEIHLKNRKIDSAVEYANRALNFNGKNIKALQIQAIGYRKQNEVDSAQTTLQKILEIDPLNHFARFEQYLLDPKEDQLNQFTLLIRNELPHETYLEIAVFYARMNLVAEAVDVLEHAPDNPVVYYWLAYLQKETAASESRQYLNRAVSMSPEFVYPFRRESIPVLKWAHNQNDSWKNGYYLGLIYWHNGLKEEAEALFAGLNETPDYAPFYLTRGKLRQELGFPHEQVLKDYQKAHQLDNNEWRTWHTLTQFYMQTGASEEALTTSEKAYNTFPDNNAIEMDYAKSLLHNQEYEKCILLLEQMHILPFEGAREGHQIFEQANLFFAIEHIKNKEYEKALKYLDNSKNWPENLGVGKPYNPDYRLQHYLEAFVYQQMGEDKHAENLFTDIRNYTQEHPSTWGPGHYVGILATRMMNNNEEAEILLKEWQNISFWRPVAQWAAADFHGDVENARHLEQEISTNNPGSSTSFRLLTEAISVTK